MGDMVLITSLTLTVIKREYEISTVQADRLYNIAYGNVCNFKLTTTLRTTFGSYQFPVKNVVLLMLVSLLLLVMNADVFLAPSLYVSQSVCLT